MTKQYKTMTNILYILYIILYILYIILYMLLHGRLFYRILRTVRATFN